MRSIIMLMIILISSCGKPPGTSSDAIVIGGKIKDSSGTTIPGVVVSHDKTHLVLLDDTDDSIARYTCTDEQAPVCSLPTGSTGYISNDCTGQIYGGANDEVSANDIFISFNNDNGVIWKQDVNGADNATISYWPQTNGICFMQTESPNYSPIKLIQYSGAFSKTIIGPFTATEK